MNPPRITIDPADLARLYVDESLPAQEVSTRLGCSAATVTRRLRELGVTMRARGPRPGIGLDASREVTWTPEVAYAVGVIATDGCLVRDCGSLAVVSSDMDLLETMRRCLHISTRITSSPRESCHRLQWRDRALYDWLLGIGLMPAKSLRLGPVDVPDTLFRDFLRGCIDGDGSIITYVDRYNTRKRPEYVYTRLFVCIVSASLRFITWLQDTVQRLFGLRGHRTVRAVEGRHDLWRLRYAKAESLSLLRLMYHAPDVPCMARKRAIAEPFLPICPATPRKGPGRPMVR
jgi:hypothetical protein